MSAGELPHVGHPDGKQRKGQADGQDGRAKHLIFREQPYRQDARHVGSHGHEPGMSAGELPHVAVHQVQADGQDDVGADVEQHQLDILIEKPQPGGAYDHYEESNEDQW